MVELTIRTTARMALVDITDRVNQALTEIGLATGMVNLFLPHTTAAIIISENWDPDVIHDLLEHLERMVPRAAGYRHQEGNSQAHILSVMLGGSIDLPVKGGRLDLGRWQGVMLAEFDGPRERIVRLSTLGA